MGKSDNQRAEEAFQVWCSTGMQDDGKTAQLCEIPYSTVTYYRRAHRWVERWHDAVGPEASILSNQGRMLLRLSTPLMARKLLQIIGGERPLINANGDLVKDENGKPVMLPYAEPRDQIQALKLALAYNWGDPRNIVYDPDGGMPSGAIPAAFAIGGEILEDPQIPETPADLEALKQSVSSLIEATVQSVNTRTKTRAGRRRV